MALSKRPNILKFTSVYPFSKLQLAILSHSLLYMSNFATFRYFLGFWFVYICILHIHMLVLQYFGVTGRWNIYLVKIPDLVVKKVSV